MATTTPGEGAGASEHHKIVIVGAGFSGIGAAIRLLEAGERDFVVLERAGELGGTWRDNTYPGCRCDVQSNLYSFSFAPNPDWSETFPSQPEIWAYLGDVARRFGVLPYLRFDEELTDATFDEATGTWRVTTPRASFTAQFLILGTGFLAEPRLPDIAGLDRFEGTVMHSARWDHGHDLAGERVAVVGTGASAIQIVPSIQPEVASLTLFQRTPGWVVPHLNRPVKPWEHRLYRRFPPAQRASRAVTYAVRELLVLSFVKFPKLMSRAERQARRHLLTQVPDAQLRAKLSPHYALGCKRVLPSNDFYPAVGRANVEVVTEAITEIGPHEVITADGTARAVDTIVLATGFHVTDNPLMDRVHGRAGATLAERFASGAPAYLGTTFAGFPNLFMLEGPNTGLGHSSMIYMIESQLNYVLDGLAKLDAYGLDVCEPSEPVVAAYNAGLQARLATTVWGSGCSSWYLDDQGRNTTLWPDFTFVFRHRTRHFDLADYVTGRLPAASGGSAGVAGASSAS